MIAVDCENFVALWLAADEVKLLRASMRAGRDVLSARVCFRAMSAFGDEPSFNSGATLTPSIDGLVPQAIERGFHNCHALFNHGSDLTSRVVR